MKYELTLPWWKLPPKKKVLTAKQRVLAEWRRIDLSEQEKALENKTRSAQDLLPAVLKQIGFDQRETEVQVLKVWNHLMDPQIREHARPVALKNGTLMVNIDSNAWHTEIMRFHRHDILKRLQHAFGRDLIARISFRVG